MPPNQKLIQHPLEAIVNQKMNSFPPCVRMLCGLVVLLRTWRLSDNKPAAENLMLMQAEAKITKVTAVLVAIYDVRMNPDLTQEFPDMDKKKRRKSVSTVRKEDYSRRHSGLAESPVTSTFQEKGLMSLFYVSKEKAVSESVRSKVKKLVPMLTGTVNVKAKRKKFVDLFSKKDYGKEMFGVLENLVSVLETEILQKVKTLFNMDKPSLQEALATLCKLVNDQNLKKFLIVLGLAQKQEAPPIQKFWRGLPKTESISNISLKMQAFLKNEDDVAHDVWSRLISPLFVNQSSPVLLEDLGLPEQLTCANFGAFFPCDDLYGAKVSDIILWRVLGWLYLSEEVEKKMRVVNENLGMKEFSYCLELVQQMLGQLRKKFGYTEITHSRLFEASLRLFHCSQPKFCQRFDSVCRFLAELLAKLGDVLSKPIVNDSAHFIKLGEFVQTNVIRCSNMHGIITNARPKIVDSDLAVYLSKGDWLFISPFAINPEKTHWLHNMVRLVPLDQMDTIIWRKARLSNSINHPNIEVVYGVTNLKSWNSVCEHSDLANYADFGFKQRLHCSLVAIGAAEYAFERKIFFQKLSLRSSTSFVKIELGDFNSWTALEFEHTEIQPTVYIDFIYSLLPEKIAKVVHGYLCELCDLKLDIFFRSTRQMLEWCLINADSLEQDPEDFCLYSSVKVPPNHLQIPYRKQVLEEEKEIIKESEESEVNIPISTIGSSTEAMTIYHHAINIYREGFGDVKRSQKMFNSVCHEYPASYFYLADSYYYGSETSLVKQDFNLAMEYYEKALEKNCLLGHVGLGDFWYFGIFKRDLEKAKHHYMALLSDRHMYKKAEARAHAGLADIYFDSQSYQDAKKHYLDAVELDPGDVPGMPGCKRALAQLALMHIEGLGVRIDLKRAESLLNKARGCRREVIVRTQLLRALNQYESAALYEDEHLHHYPRDY